MNCSAPAENVQLRARAQTIATAACAASPVLSIPTAFIRICKGDAEAALVLTILLHWTGRGRMAEGQLAKSTAALHRETGIGTLGRNGQVRSIETARKNLTSLGFIKTYQGVWYHMPCVHWQVQLDTVEAALLAEGIDVSLPPQRAFDPTDLSFVDDPEAEKLLAIFIERTAGVRTGELTAQNCQAWAEEARWWAYVGNADILNAAIDWALDHVTSPDKPVTITRPKSIHKVVEIELEKAAKQAKKQLHDQLEREWNAQSAIYDCERIFDLDPERWNTRKRELALLIAQEAWLSVEGFEKDIWLLEKKGVADEDVLCAIRFIKLHGSQEGFERRVRNYSRLARTIIRQMTLRKNEGKTVCSIDGNDDAAVAYRLAEGKTPYRVYLDLETGQPIVKTGMRRTVESV